MNLSVAPAVSFPTSRIDDLHEKTDAELDLLPYGVICLDTLGIVRRYNRVEARFARLDRSLVLGKPFFGVVAPCTATPEFEGRFRAFLADPLGPPTMTFRYVFAFRFGAQEVDVELRRTRNPDQAYVCIGRRAFRGSVADGTPGGDRPAIALAELAPEEKRQGVVRDGVERRGVLVDARLFEALQASSEFRALAPALGAAWGRRAALDLEAEALESFEGALRDLPVVTVFELLTRTIRSHGWGHLLVDFEHSAAGLLTFHLERSVLAEAWGSGNEPACGLVAGYLGAILAHLAGRPMVVREAACRAQGRGTCTFFGTGQAREDDLVRAFEAGAFDGRSVVRVLGGAR